MKSQFPLCQIVLTTMTRTGNEAARRKMPEADRVLYFPLDHPLFIQRAIRRINPGLLLVAETELWPNLLAFFGKKRIPILLFNGRISLRSFRRYRRFKFFFEGFLKSISLFLMQTEEDRSRIVEIGAPTEKTRVMGNLKFDQTFPEMTQSGAAEMARALGLPGNESVLIAGSTHSGEEEILIGLFKELRSARSRPFPYPCSSPSESAGRGGEDSKERGDFVDEKDRSPGRRPLTRSRKQRTRVILLDTMGELMKLYSLGTVVFIGGSLVPVGGHNPLEPLFFNRCVLFGPHMFNFQEISTRLVETGGAVQVKGREDLLFHLKRLLSDEGARKAVGERGSQFLQRHRGATERMFEEIRPFLLQLQNEDWGLRNSGIEGSKCQTHHPELSSK